MIRLSPSPSAKPITLEALEVILQDHFKEITFDLEEGESQKASHLLTLNRLNAPPDLVQRRESLDAALVTASDFGDDAYIEFLYFPGEEIYIGFSSQSHESNATPLAQRLAKHIYYSVSYE